MNWSPKYGVSEIDKEFIIDSQSLDNYHTLNSSRKNIISSKLKHLYNKNNVKKEFEKIGFKVPKLIFYSKDKFNILDVCKDYESFVAKPAHMSFSDNVFIVKDKTVDISNINILNDCIDKETDRDEPQMLKKCEKGILIEEYIKVIYELKVFVVWGCPLIADLRTGNNEILHRVDFIYKDNRYIDWENEYNLIKKFADKFKIDFFRIDLLFDGQNFYASECAFMPSTILPTDIEDMISSKWRSQYYKYYYPFLG